jgi:hypothetical protein
MIFGAAEPWTGTAGKGVAAAEEANAGAAKDCGGGPKTVACGGEKGGMLEGRGAVVGGRWPCCRSISMDLNRSPAGGVSGRLGGGGGRGSGGGDCTRSWVLVEGLSMEEALVNGGSCRTGGAAAQHACAAG